MAGKLARLLIINRWGRLALLTAILVLLLLVYQDLLLEEVYPLVRDTVLRTVGFGFFPLALWLSTAVAVMRLEPRWLARRWRWWLSAALLATGIQAALGGVHGPEGIIADKTLGGIAGQYMWGNSPLQGVPVTAVALLLAATVLHPAMTYRAGVAITRTLAQLLLLLGYWLIRGAGSMAQRATTLLTTKRTRTVDEQPAASDHVAEPTAAYSDTEGEPIPSDLLAKDEEELPAEEPTEETLEEKEEPTPTVARRNKSVPTYAGGGWRLPAIDLLEQGHSVSITEDETQEVAGRIEESLSTHGVQVTVDQVRPGPTVTLYGLTPGWVRRYKNVQQRDEDGVILRDDSGRPVTTRQEEQTRVKVDSILAREKDLALSLAAPSLRIQAPVPGESIVGIEVPNREPVLVTIRSVLETPGFQDIVKGGGLALALGQGSGGDPVASDLRQLPHLLIAGATGSGKSVCINTLIVSLVTQVPPEKLRLLLIDPKRVELTPFNGLPHLATPVVVDSEPAVKALKGILKEMFLRYRRLEELGVRNIDGYLHHPQATEPMPYLVVAIDELADLMMAAPYDIEQTICRLAQLGRATGIHLIVATQRPSVDVVTGLIKANFPSRISFAVVSQVDSRTILDSAGAERLLGKGDMLFLSGDTPKPQRVQSAYVSDREIGQIVDFWRSQDGPPLQPLNLEPDPQESQNGSSPRSVNGGGQDELFDKAIELTSRYSHLSTSLLQRRLRIGYPRAARLMDQLEDNGIIGAGEQGKSRDVLRPGG